MSTVVIRESPQDMRPTEAIAWRLTLDAALYPSPSAPASTLYDVTDGAEEDVSSTSLTGTAAIVGTTFTSARVHGLTAGHTYRLGFSFASGGNTFEPVLFIRCVA